MTPFGVVFQARFVGGPEDGNTLELRSFKGEGIPFQVAAGFSDPGIYERQSELGGVYKFVYRVWEGDVRQFDRGTSDD